MNQPARIVPGKIAIRHAIEAARKSGMDVAGVEICVANGTIRVLEARAIPQLATEPVAANEWDREL